MRRADYLVGPRSGIGHRRSTCRSAIRIRTEKRPCNLANPLLNHRCDSDFTLGKHFHWLNGLRPTLLKTPPLDDHTKLATLLNLRPIHDPNVTKLSATQSP